MNFLCLKYYGYLDLDLDIDSLTQSACSPFNVCFESRNEAKLAIVEQIKQHGLQAFIGMCPLFKRLYDAVNVITEELGQCVSFLQVAKASEYYGSILNFTTLCTTGIKVTMQNI